MSASAKKVSSISSNHHHFTYSHSNFQSGSAKKPFSQRKGKPKPRDDECASSSDSTAILSSSSSSGLRGEVKTMADLPRFPSFIEKGRSELEFPSNRLEAERVPYYSSQSASFLEEISTWDALKTLLHSLSLTLSSAEHRNEQEALSRCAELVLRLEHCQRERDQQLLLLRRDFSSPVRENTSESAHSTSPLLKEAARMLADLESDRALLAQQLSACTKQHAEQVRELNDTVELLKSELREVKEQIVESRSFDASPRHSHVICITPPRTTNYASRSSELRVSAPNSPFAPPTMSTPSRARTVSISDAGAPSPSLEVFELRSQRRVLLDQLALLESELQSVRACKVTVETENEALTEEVNRLREEKALRRREREKETTAEKATPTKQTRTISSPHERLSTARRLLFDVEGGESDDLTEHSVPGHVEIILASNMLHNASSSEDSKDTMGVEEAYSIVKRHSSSNGERPLSVDGRWMSTGTQTSPTETTHTDPQASSTLSKGIDTSHTDTQTTPTPFTQCANTQTALADSAAINTQTTPTGFADMDTQVTLTQCADTQTTVTPLKDSDTQTILVQSTHMDVQTAIAQSTDIDTQTTISQNTDIDVQTSPKQCATIDTQTSIAHCTDTQTTLVSLADMDAQTTLTQSTDTETQTHLTHRPQCTDTDTQTTPTQHANTDVQTVPTLYAEIDTQTNLAQFAHIDVQTTLTQSTDTQTCLAPSADIDTQTMISQNTDIDVQTSPKQCATIDTQTSITHCADTQTTLMPLADMDAQTTLTQSTDTDTQTHLAQYVETDTQTTPTQPVNIDVQTVLTQRADTDTQSADTQTASSQSAHAQTHKTDAQTTQTQSIDTDTQTTLTQFSDIQIALTQSTDTDTDAQNFPVQTTDSDDLSGTGIFRDASKHCNALQKSHSADSFAGVEKISLRGYGSEGEISPSPAHVERDLCRKKKEERHCEVVGLCDECEACDEKSMSGNEHVSVNSSSACSASSMCDISVVHGDESNCMLDNHLTDSHSVCGCSLCDGSVCVCDDSMSVSDVLDSSAVIEIASLCSALEEEVDCIVRLAHGTGELSHCTNTQTHTPAHSRVHSRASSLYNTPSDVEKSPIDESESERESETVCMLCESMKSQLFLLTEREQQLSTSLSERENALQRLCDELCARDERIAQLEKDDKESESGRGTCTSSACATLRADYEHFQSRLRDLHLDPYDLRDALLLLFGTDDCCAALLADDLRAPPVVYNLTLRAETLRIERDSLQERLAHYADWERQRERLRMGVGLHAWEDKRDKEEAQDAGYLLDQLIEARLAHATVCLELEKLRLSTGTKKSTP